MADKENSRPFWISLPGIMTGVASLATAIITVLTFTTGNCEKKQPQPPAAALSGVEELGNLSDCQEITGRWDWFIGGEVTMMPDGALAWRITPTDPLPSGIGRWTCSGTTPRIFMLTWQTGLTDEVRLSPDGLSLAGSNRTGARISGTRKT